jgi:hypothetical protein
MTLSALSAIVKVGAVPLPVRDVALGMDQTRVPFGMVDLTIPYDPATIDALDPRTTPAPRLSVALDRRFADIMTLSAISSQVTGKTLAAVSTKYLGATLGALTAAYGTAWNAFGFRPAQSFSADLVVRSRDIDYAANTVRVTAGTDEALLLDYGLMSATPVSPAVLTVADAVRLALSYAAPGAVLVTTDGAQAITAESAVWKPGVSAWEYASTLCTSAGLRLWCDEKRVWRLAAPDAITAPGQVTLSASESVTAAADTITRETDAWFDGVVVTYTWTDAGNVHHEQSDVAGAASASRVLLVQEDRPFPRAGAAAARLRKVKGQGRVMTVAAVADLAAYPAQAVSLSVPNSPTQTGYVAAVTWALPADEMTVATRGLVDTPVSSWAYGNVGQSWTDVPAGMRWNTFNWTGVAP